MVSFSVACSVAESKPSSSSGVIDFGDPNAKQFATQLKSLLKNKKSNKVINIIQFGDSHTAADFFTGEFRTLMQKKYGDAGIGWITPIAIKGQNHVGVNWNSKHWEVLSSRVLSNIDFPMGGFIAKPIKDTATIQITPKIQDNQIWQMKISFKILEDMTNPINILDAYKRKINYSAVSKKDVWQTTSFKSHLPIVINGKENTEIGGVWLTREKKSGVTVSAIGSNGAKQTIWQKWSPNWYKELSSSQVDLVILEYGTNESFDETLDANEYRTNLVNNIRKIRKLLPKVSILLISPPDTMINENEIPKSYNLVKHIQQQVAKSEKTLFWDWQAAMGGKKSVISWQKQGLARQDLVHQTLQGYKESAKIFYNDLNEFVKKNSD